MWKSLIRKLLKDLVLISVRYLIRDFYLAWILICETLSHRKSLQSPRTSKRSFFVGVYTLLLFSLDLLNVFSQFSPFCNNPAFGLLWRLISRFVFQSFWSFFVKMRVLRFGVYCVFRFIRSLWPMKISFEDKASLDVAYFLPPPRNLWIVQ